MNVGVCLPSPLRGLITSQNQEEENSYEFFDIRQAHQSLEENAEGHQTRSRRISKVVRLERGEERSSSEDHQVFD
jgi:hypothetical protein